MNPSVGDAILHRLRVEECFSNLVFHLQVQAFCFLHVIYFSGSGKGRFKMDNSIFWPAPQPLLNATARLLGSSAQPWTHFILCSMLAYPTLVSLLRFRRQQSIQKQFNYPTRESFANMTDEDAFTIQRIIAEQEFPFMFGISLGFALFKVLLAPIPRRAL
jgi:hypothetical protein